MPIKKRIYAFLVDLLAIVLIQKIMIFSFFYFILEYMPFFVEPIQHRFWFNLHFIHDSTILITYLGYFFLCLYISNGYTLGKFIFKMKVVGKKPMLTLDESFFRSVAYTICYLSLFLPFLINAFHPYQRGLPDALSQTFSQNDEEQILVLPMAS